MSESVTDLKSRLASAHAALVGGIATAQTASDSAALKLANLQAGLVVLNNHIANADSEVQVEEENDPSYQLFQDVQILLHANA